MTSEPQQHEREPVVLTADDGHSPVQLKASWLWLSMAALAVLVGGSMVAMFFLLSWMERGNPRVNPVDRTNQAERMPSFPPLNPAQVAERKAYEREQEELLNSYGWINEPQKTARIPIDVAMRQTVERYGRNNESQ